MKMTNNFMGYVNPYNGYQQRLNQMENQYSHYAQQIPSVLQQGYRTMLVSNVEEANASQISTDGQPTFFYNKGKAEIYLKQFDINTGGAIFQRFQLATMPVNESNEQKTTDVYSDRLNSIESKLDSLALMFEDKAKKKKGDE